MNDAKPPNWRRLIKLAGRRWAEVDGAHRPAAFAHYPLLSLLPLEFMLASAGPLFVERTVATRRVVQWVSR